MEDYFRLANEKENEPSACSFSSCKSVLNSKAKDELLVLSKINFISKLSIIRLFEKASLKKKKK